MNDTTYSALQVEAMSVNAAGAIVTGQAMTMPVAGGDIVLVSDDVMQDNTIIAGYFDLYLLAERAGAEFARSDDYRFVEDQVVFKGTARYDGAPAIAEAFVVNWPGCGSPDYGNLYRGYCQRYPSGIPEGGRCEPFS